MCSKNKNKKRFQTLVILTVPSGVFALGLQGRGQRLQEVKEHRRVCFVGRVCLMVRCPQRMPPAAQYSAIPPQVARGLFLVCSSLPRCGGMPPSMNASAQVSHKAHCILLWDDDTGKGHMKSCVQSRKSSAY